MSPKDLFQSLVKDHAAPFLKSRGFRKKGMNFGLRGVDVWGVLTFWRDKWNNASEQRFTITINVACDALRKLNPEPFDPKVVPGSDDPTTQWWADIGTYLKGPRQTSPYSSEDATDWWEIRNQSDFDDVCPRVLKALAEVAIPELVRRRSLADFVEMYHKTGNEGVLFGMMNLPYALLLAGDEQSARRILGRKLRRVEQERPVALPAFKRKIKEIGIDPDSLMV